MSPAPPSKKMVQLAMRFCPKLCQKWHNGMEMPVMPVIAAIPSTPPLETDCEALRRALLIETSALLMDSNDFASLHFALNQLPLPLSILSQFGLHKQGGKKCCLLLGEDT